MKLAAPLVASFVVGAVSGAAAVYAYWRLGTAAPGSAPGGTTSVYTGAITALMGAILGMVGTTMMDWVKERRQVGRKANISRVRVTRLLRMLRTIRDIADDKYKGREDIKIGEWIDDAVSTGKVPPDFEDLVDTEDDFETVGKVEGAFRVAADRFGMLVGEDVASRLRTASKPNDPRSNLDYAIQVLEEAEKRLKERA